MLFWLGAAAFALTILISVSLHELGHMITGKRFGMKVTQYFVGFGPTVFSFRRGETEYGLKAIPLGGFCKIVGMTPQDDDVAPEDQPRAMWRFPVWKRTIVMSAGSITHFALAIGGIYVMALVFGLPNPAYPATDPERRAQPAKIMVSDCISLTLAEGQCTAGVSGVPGPAQSAKLRDGDVITKIGTAPVANYGQLVDAIRAQRVGPVVFEYQRDGQAGKTTVTLVEAERPGDDGGIVKSAMAGVALDTSATPYYVKYGPVGAISATGDQTLSIFKATGEAIKKVPQKLPALWHSITGGERDPNTPISVLGASRLGGEAVEHGAWDLFWQIFIGLNVFIGVFNLLPLLPLDGGHIAIAWYERVRSWLYQRLRKPDPGRVDYYKLMPLTYAVILIGGAFTLLTVTADIINPITIFK